nr:reverse transcriptase domain-containing protein [Tanacetum cinerariifolium]
MSTSTHPITIPSDSNIEDAFSSTNTPNYTSASPDYFPASSRNTSPNRSDDLSKYLLASLAISPFYNDPYMKIMQAYTATDNDSPILPQAHIAPPTSLPPSPRDFDQLETKLQEARTQISRFQREQIRHDDEIVLARVRTSTQEILIEDIQNDSQEDINICSTSHESAINININKLVADSVAAALEAQAATMANTDNTNRNTRERKALVARKCSYKDNSTKDCKVKFATVLYPTMVPNSEKLMEVFIGGLPRSIEGNVTASKPQTLEEAITIT